VSIKFEFAGAKPASLGKPSLLFTGIAGVSPALVEWQIAWVEGFSFNFNEPAA
jgi:hypothetical protein